jgi:hypothetical protein
VWAWRGSVVKSSSPRIIRRLWATISWWQRVEWCCSDGRPYYWSLGMNHCHRQVNIVRLKLWSWNISLFCRIRLIDQRVRHWSIINLYWNCTRYEQKKRHDIHRVNSYMVGTVADEPDRHRYPAQLSIILMRSSKYIVKNIPIPLHWFLLHPRLCHPEFRCEQAWLEILQDLKGSVAVALYSLCPESRGWGEVRPYGSCQDVRPDEVSASFQGCLFVLQRITILNSAWWSHR